MAKRRAPKNIFEEADAELGSEYGETEASSDDWWRRHLNQQQFAEKVDEMGESFAKQPYHPVTTDDDKKYGPRARND